MKTPAELGWGGCSDDRDDAAGDGRALPLAVAMMLLLVIGLPLTEEGEKIKPGPLAVAVEALLPADMTVEEWVLPAEAFEARWFLLLPLPPDARSMEAFEPLLRAL